MASTAESTGVLARRHRRRHLHLRRRAVRGSTGAIQLDKPIADMAATPDGKGYWLLASDGGVFNFGDAPFAGSSGGAPGPDPAQKLVTNPRGPAIGSKTRTERPSPSETHGPPPTPGLMYRNGDGRRQGRALRSSRGSGSRTSGAATVRSAMTARAWRWPRGRTGQGSLTRVSDDQYHTAGEPVALRSHWRRGISCSGGRARRN